jgi:BMFP domain-containing protein YqiC
MVDAADDNVEWVQQWIAQQRELLAKMRAGDPARAARGAQGAERQSADPWLQWSQLGNSYLSGLLNGMPGAGTNGADAPAGNEAFDAWRAAWTNSLAQLSAPGGWSDLLNRTPPLGLFREHNEAWRAVAAAHADCQRLEQEFGAVLRRVQTDSLALLEFRVRALRDSGSPVQGFRQLYDLWVDCSEQVFSAVAHSSAYGHLQGEMSNAAMRLRSRMQKVIEQGLRQFDLPTRSELNSVHQQLRQLRQRLDELQPTATPSASSRSPARRTAKVSAKKKSATRAQSRARATRKSAR